MRGPSRLVIITVYRSWTCSVSAISVMNPLISSSPDEPSVTSHESYVYSMPTFTGARKRRRQAFANLVNNQIDSRWNHA